MKTLLNQAVDDMKTDGIVLSFLGGQRQRYQHFGFDPAGTETVLSIGPDNLYRLYKSPRNWQINIQVIQPFDVEILDKINEWLNIDSLYCPLRNRTALYEILVSWQDTPIFFTDAASGKPIGYAVVGESDVTEFFVADSADVVRAACAICDHYGRTLTFKFPSFQTDYIQPLSPIGNGVSEHANHQYCIIQYEPLLRASMRLAAKTKKLADGSICLDIHGRCGEEKLRLTVQNGEPLVEKCNDSDCLPLEHLEATNLLYAPVYAQRNALDPAVRSWLPLPLWISQVDNV